MYLCKTIFRLNIYFVYFVNRRTELKITLISLNGKDFRKSLRLDITDIFMHNRAYSIQELHSSLTFLCKFK